MVVGLRWTPPSHGLRYEITRDGQLIGTVAADRFADTSVEAATTYRYVVGALDGSGHRAVAGPVIVTTAAPARHGDAPYGPSTLIRAMDWDFSAAYRSAEGSDLWPVTWGKDGSVYAFFGDGGGFGGDDYRGRTSFGIATLDGPPPPTAATEHNLYGGYRGRYPSLLSGKVRSIMAVGSDFYAIAGIYRDGDAKVRDPQPIAGSPDHLEMIYSRHDAHSWQASGWTFCRGDSGAFCPSGFVNFGRGGAGAPDAYVYLYGMSSVADGIARGTGARTYLARVHKRRILNPAAYEYFAGLDAKSKPIWSSDAARLAAVFTDRNVSRPGCGGHCAMAMSLEEAVYNFGLRRYIGMAQGDYLGQTAFYEAPAPWGPWSTLAYDNIDSDGSGGWGNLGMAAGSSLGVHAINAWTSPDGETMWMAYSSDGVAPPEAAFPAPGIKLDAFQLVRVRLERAPAARDRSP
jgi:hypothetical protein